MDFETFVKFLPKIEKEKLLAITAHQKMAPLERFSSLYSAYYDDKNPRKAAVLLLVYPKNREAHLVLIVRNAYEGVHASQIAFPGGKEEISDSDLSFTALRETEEEVGVPMEQIKIVRPFSQVYIPPSNFLVAPFLGITTNELQFRLDPHEVKAIVEFPLRTLLDDEILTEVKMKTSYANEMLVPAFKIEEHIVWGATAMMLSELKELLKNSINS